MLLIVVYDSIKAITVCFACLVQQHSPRPLHSETVGKYKVFLVLKGHSTDLSVNLLVVDRITVVSCLLWLWGELCPLKMSSWWSKLGTIFFRRKHSNKRVWIVKHVGIYLGGRL